MRRPDLLRAAQRKKVIDLFARHKAYTVFSEYSPAQDEGEGFEINRIRDFKIDDDPESLDVADLALGERNVVVWDALERATIMVFADVSSSMTFFPKFPEYSKALTRDIATGIIVNSAHETMRPVGLVLFSDQVNRMFVPQAGEYALYILNQYLAYEEDGEGGTSLECILPYAERFRDATICVVSDFQDLALKQNCKEWCSRISQFDVVPIVVQDALEKIDFGGRGYFLCRDPETGSEHASYLTRERYARIRDESNRFYRTLADAFDSFGIPALTLDSPDIGECYDKLRKFFSEKARREARRWQS